MTFMRKASRSAGKIAGKLKKLFAYQAYDSCIIYNTLGQGAVISPGKTLLRCHIDPDKPPLEIPFDYISDYSERISNRIPAMRYAATMIGREIIYPVSPVKLRLKGKIMAPVDAKGRT